MMMAGPAHRSLSTGSASSPSSSSSSSLLFPSPTSLRGKMRAMAQGRTWSRRALQRGEGRGRHRPSAAARGAEERGERGRLPREVSWHEDIIGDPPERTYNDGSFYYVRKKEGKDELDIAPDNRQDGSVVRPSTWSGKQDGGGGLGAFDDEWNMMWTDSKDVPFSRLRYTVDIDCSVDADVSTCYTMFCAREDYFRFMPFIHSIRQLDSKVPELARVEMYYRYQLYPTLQLIFGLLTVERRENELISYETDHVPGEKMATRHGPFPMKVRASRREYCMQA